MKKLIIQYNDKFNPVEKILDGMSIKGHLCITLYQVTHKMTRLYADLLAPHNLTFPQYQVLVALWEHGTCTVGALCSVLTLDTSTLTPVLKRLHALGFIERFRDRVDERRVYAALTDKGRAFRQDAMALRCRLIDETRVDAAEYLELQRMLRKFSVSMDRAGSPG